jgi:hypothetical protein
VNYRFILELYKSSRASFVQADRERRAIAKGRALTRPAGRGLLPHQGNISRTYIAPLLPPWVERVNSIRRKIDGATSLKARVTCGALTKMVFIAFAATSNCAVRYTRVEYPHVSAHARGRHFPTLGRHDN